MGGKEVGEGEDRGKHREGQVEENVEEKAGKEKAPVGTVAEWQQKRHCLQGSGAVDWGSGGME